MVLTSKGSNFSEFIYLSIDLKGPSFQNLLTGCKQVQHYLILVETVRHIWLAPRLCGILCFLPRLPFAKNGSLPRFATGSIITQTVSTCSFFYWTEILEKIRFTRKPKLTGSLSRKENWRTSLCPSSFAG